MAEGMSDVVINIGAKVDEARVKAAADKVTRSLELVMRRAQAIGTDAAKALTKQIDAIKGGIADGSIGAKEAEILANQFIHISRSAKGTTDIIGQYGNAIRIAAANSQRFTDVLDSLAQTEQALAEAEAQRAAEQNKADFAAESAIMQSRLGKMGTAGARRASAQLATLQEGVAGGAIAKEDVAALAKVIKDLNNKGDEAKNIIKSLGSAFLSTAAQSDKAAEALSKVDVAYSNIKTKGSNALEALAKNTEIDNEIQNIADAITVLATEAEKAKPQSEAFAEAIDDIAKILFSDKAIDATALKGIDAAFKNATAEAQKLNGEVARKLSPNLLAVGRSLNQIKTTVKTSDLAGAANEIAGAIGNIDPQAQRVASSILEWAKNIKGVGTVIAKFPGTFAIIGMSIAGIIAALNKVKSIILESEEAIARSNVEAGEQRFERTAKSLESEIKLNQRKLELQRAQIENARAIEDAQRGMISAQNEYNKALELAGALSEEEKNAIERKYARLQAQKENNETITNVGRARADTIMEIEENIKRIQALERANAQDAKNKAAAEIQAAELRKKGDDINKGDFAASVGKWFKEAFGQELEGKTYDEMAKQLEEAAKKSSETSTARKVEIEDLRTRNQGLYERSEIYTKQIEAANKQLEAAKAQEESAEVIRRREIAAQNQERRWTLEDREWEEERATREDRWSREETLGGARVASKHADERLARAKADLAEDAKALDEAEKKELERINAQRETEGKAKILNLSEADESEKSAKFLQERARYENLVLRDKANVRSAEQTKFSADLQGDEKRAELYGQMYGSKNRLTAMGLGGDVSAGKETANNTKLAANKLTELVPLVHTLVNNRSGQSLEKPTIATIGATWGME